MINNAKMWKQSDPMVAVAQLRNGYNFEKQVEKLKSFKDDFHAFAQCAYFIAWV